MLFVLFGLVYFVSIAQRIHLILFGLLYFISIAHRIHLIRQYDWIVVRMSVKPIQIKSKLFLCDNCKNVELLFKKSINHVFHILKSILISLTDDECEVDDLECSYPRVTCPCFCFNTWVISLGLRDALLIFYTGNLYFVCAVPILSSIAYVPFSPIVHQLSRTLQCTSISEGGGFDYDQNYLCAMYVNISSEHKTWTGHMDMYI